MATYEITSPDGAIYEITAPDNASEAEILNYAKSSMNSRKPQTRGSWTDPLMQGLTGGWADELGYMGTKAGATLAGANPTQAKAMAQAEMQGQRDDLKSFQSRNPLTSLGLEFSGGLVSGAPAVKLAGTGKRALGVAGLESGLFAAGAADENKLNWGMGGAAAGTGMALALPTLFAAAHGGGSWLYNHLVKPIYDRYAKNPTTAGDKIIKEGFSNVSPDDIIRRKQELGDMAMPGELGDQKTIGLTQRAVIESPDSLAQARTAVGQRREGMSARVKESARELFGDRPSILESLDEITARQSALSSDAYKEAYKYDIIGNLDDELLEIMNRPAIRNRMKSVLENLRNGGKPIPEMEKIVMQGDDFIFTKEAFPNMEALDLMKRELDRQVNTAFRNGAVDAHSMKIARNALRDKLDNMNPAYKDARAVFAGDAELADAILEGEKILTKKGREVQEYVRKLNPSQKEAYLTGVMEAITEKMNAARNGTLSSFNFLETDKVKNKLRLLFPPTRDGADMLENFFRALQKERDLAFGEGLIVGGSQTAMRQHGGDLLRRQAGRSGAMDIATSPVRGAFGAAASKVDDLINSLPQQTLDYVGKLLTTPGQEREIIRILQTQAIPEETISQILSNYMRNMGGVAPAAVGSSTSLAQ